MLLLKIANPVSSPNRQITRICSSALPSHRVLQARDGNFVSLRWSPLLRHTPRQLGRLGISSLNAVTAKNSFGRVMVIPSVRWGWDTWGGEVFRLRMRQEGNIYIFKTNQLSLEFQSFSFSSPTQSHLLSSSAPLRILQTPKIMAQVSTMLIAVLSSSFLLVSGSPVVVTERDEVRVVASSSISQRRC